MHMTTTSDEDRLLDAAEHLFYEQGFHTIGMDDLRSASALPLKRIYTMFKGKESIIVAMLARRDKKWISSLERHIEKETQPIERLLSIFDWLHYWLSHDGHRGCAWINAYGELGGTSPAVTKSVRAHKKRLHTLVAKLTENAGASRETADAIFLLIEGSMVTAGITGDASVAKRAQKTAKILLGI